VFTVHINMFLVKITHNSSVCPSCNNVTSEDLGTGEWNMSSVVTYCQTCTKNVL